MTRSTRTSTTIRPHLALHRGRYARRCSRLAALRRHAIRPEALSTPSRSSPSRCPIIPRFATSFETTSNSKMRRSPASRRPRDRCNNWSEDKQRWDCGPRRKTPGSTSVRPSEQLDNDPRRCIWAHPPPNDYWVQHQVPGHRDGRPVPGAGRPHRSRVAQRPGSRARIRVWKTGDE